MTEPKEHGCICQTCSERGVECINVARIGEDECEDCMRGCHTTDRAWDIC
jgi:hypothetical protein